MTDDVHVLRVFLSPGGTGGNPLGVVLDPTAVRPDRRQGVAAALAYSETVFLDDESGALRIFTPASELPFAGHPLVGCGWLLRHLGLDVATLRPPAGEVPAWADGDLSWIRSRPEWAPAMTVRRLGSPAEVDALDGPGDEGFLYAWAWLDMDAGTVRSRMFAPEHGIVEDEATGAAAVRLTGELGRPLRIRQGTGSELITRPGPDGTVELGGRVALDGARPLPGPERGSVARQDEQQ